MENNKLFDVQGEKETNNEHEYCWYTGQKCGAKFCGVDCPIYRAVTGRSLMDGFHDSYDSHDST